MNSVVIIFAPIILLGVPVFLVSKFFEKKMKPKRNFKAFMLWVLAVIAFSLAWYFLCMVTFFKFFSLRS